jgi:membrane-associated phospholipid phosphatase
MDLHPFFFGTGPIEWVQETIGRGYPLPFRLFSLLGDTWGVLLAMGVAFWLFGRRALYPVVGAIVVGAATKVLFAAAFSAERPAGPGITVYEELEVGSFPSGHVYQGVLPWGMLYALGRVRLWVPALVAVLVGLGRVYLGVHFVGDVLGGVAFAAAAAWALAKGWAAVRGWLERRSFRFYLIAAAVAVAGTLVYLTTVGDSPRRFEVIGLALGAALALPVEYRWLRYEPGEGGWATRLKTAAVGAGGLAAFVALDRLVVGDALALGAVVAGLATLWVLVAAPALSAVLGWGARSSPRSVLA